MRAFGIVGGGATLAFGGAITAVQFLTAVGLGIGKHAYFILSIDLSIAGGLGVGANFLAQSMCTTPYCTATSGQCCLLVTTMNGLQCPDSC